VDRNTMLWTLVVFFGASILFATLRDATRDEGTGVTLAVQLLAGIIVVGAIVLIVRRRR
jgi:ABC-type arginine transport system permease subunit